MHIRRRFVQAHSSEEAELAEPEPTLKPRASKKKRREVGLTAKVRLGPVKDVPCRCHLAQDGRSSAWPGAV